MLLIGLTGSIATGKSTVSTLLSSPPYSMPIVDADLLARQVVEPGRSGYKAIVAHFGPSTPDLLLPPIPEGQDSVPAAGPVPRRERAREEKHGRPINRAVLGRRVFGNEPERRADRAVLNGIVHPAVRRAMYRALLRHYLSGHRAVVLDVPLLFEAGMDVMCGVVAVVAVRDPAVQMARLRARDPHLSQRDAEDRVRSQGDVRDKARRCEARGSGRGVVVWNDSDRAELEREVARAVDEIYARSPAWWNWALLLCPPLGVAVGAWNFWQNRRINQRWREQEEKERAKL